MINKQQKLEGIPLSPVNEWSKDDVSAWLQFIHMERYIPAFSEIYGKQLSTLAEKNGNNGSLLEQLVGKKSHQKKIQRRLIFALARRDTKQQHRSRYSTPITDHISRQKQQTQQFGTTAEKGSADVFTDGYNEKDDNQKSHSRGKHRFSLHVCGVKYNFKCPCTFCQEDTSTAFVYCPTCRDFLCASCDETVHDHAKRRSHERIRISKFDLHRASQIIINSLRNLKCRKELKKRARHSFTRFYDSNSRRHYYLNVNTNVAQWRKPYCFNKSEDIKPFLSPEQGACIIQSIVRSHQAHLLVVNMIGEQYQKVYDLKTGFYCYIYNGIAKFASEAKTLTTAIVKSNLAPTLAPGERLMILRKYDIPIAFTKNLAYMRLQKFCRLVLARKHVRNIVREVYDCCLDPISGHHYFVNEISGWRSWEKPFLLGKERWDPDDVRLWNTKDVAQYFRKKIKIEAKPSGIISQTVYRFGIDGPLLLTFEMEDFHYTGITKPVHKLQILLDLKCRSFSKHHKPLDCELRRRDRFRKHFRLVSAARSLQKKIRLRLSMKNTKNRPVKNEHVHLIGDIDVRLRGGWWSDQTRDYVEPPGKRFGKRGPNEVKGNRRFSYLRNIDESVEIRFSLSGTCK